jgi:hypothetical protein
MFGRRYRRSADSDAHWVENLSLTERAAIVMMFRDELARGWVPQRTDLEAALSAYRLGSTSRNSQPA